MDHMLSLPQSKLALSVPCTGSNMSPGSNMSLSFNKENCRDLFLFLSFFSISRRCSLTWPPRRH